MVLLEIFLGCYTVRLYDSKASKNIDLEDNEYSISIQGLIKDYFQTRKKYTPDIKDGTLKEHRPVIVKKENKTGKKESVLTVGTNFIEGVIETGESGYTSTLMNAETGDENYNRKVNDVELFPFYFKISFERVRNDQYVLILQRFGVHGSKTALGNDLQKFFRLKYSENSYRHIKIEINDLVPEKAIKEYVEKGNIKKVTLIKKQLAMDEISRLNYDNKKINDLQKEVSMELVIKAPALPFKTKLLDSLKMNFKNTKQFIEMKNFEYDNVKINIEMNGKNRTLDFVNYRNFKPYYDVTSEIKFNDDGHPSFESIQLAANSLIEDLRNGSI